MLEVKDLSVEDWCVQGEKVALMKPFSRGEFRNLGLVNIREQEVKRTGD